jgi:hypothetical protein
MEQQYEVSFRYKCGKMHLSSHLKKKKENKRKKD